MHGSYQSPKWWSDCRVSPSGGVMVCGWVGDIGPGDMWGGSSGGWTVDGLLVQWMVCRSIVKTSIHTFFFWKIWIWKFPRCFSLCSLCTGGSFSLAVQTCVMPKDCQTSDWSPWSPCSKTCRSTDLSPGYRLRSRMVTQIPIGGGKQCPAQEEKEACNIIGNLLPNCPRYSRQPRSSHFEDHRPQDKTSVNA